MPAAIPEDQNMVRLSVLARNLSLLLICLALSCLGLLAACDSSGTPAPTGTVQPPTTPTSDILATPDLGDEGTVLPQESATPSPLAAELSEKESVQLYKLAVGALLSKEKVSNVYISPYVGGGERLDNPDENSPLPDTLTDSLNSTGARTYKLLDFSAAVGPLEDGGKVKNNGVFLTLGPINRDEAANGVVTIRASIYRERADAEGNIYRFKRSTSSTGWTLQESSIEWSEP